jgi:hypothetical protein
MDNFIAHAAVGVYIASHRPTICMLGGKSSQMRVQGATGERGRHSKRGLEEAVGGERHMYGSHAGST